MTAEIMHSIYTIVIFGILGSSVVHSLPPEQPITGGMLYPRETMTRDIKDLGGIWQFQVDLSTWRNQSLVKEWWKRPLAENVDHVLDMPVPSSYNDITANRSIQNFVGWAWYETTFQTPKHWLDTVEGKIARRIVLRFESVRYYASVWLNGMEVMSHEGGHLPFEAEISQYLFAPPVTNRLTVAVNSTMHAHTLPPGSFSWEPNTNRYPENYFIMDPVGNFFHYCGIDRRVLLYSTPLVYIDDITVDTTYRNISGNITGVVNYNISAIGTTTQNKVYVSVIDKSQPGKAKVISSSKMVKGDIAASVEVPDAKLWWPMYMSNSPGFMYTLRVTIVDVSGIAIYDQYDLPIGIRTVRVTKTQFLINEQPFYFHGFGKHEDYDLRGKAVDPVTNLRDFYLMKWIHANSFRTSHYPYAEEIMDLADKYGIAVIDESPAVGLASKENFDPVVLQKHLKVESELIRRDKNRPGVVMWSLANEASLGHDYSTAYFKAVFQHVKALDKTRPASMVLNQHGNATFFCDVILFNVYHGWYNDRGRLETVALQMYDDMSTWYKELQRPVMITEYGAGAVAGMHLLPSFTYTEDYQVEILRENQKAFDKLKAEGYFVGEMIWNFADFKQPPLSDIVINNRKGVFTRQRDPKESAYLVKDRYVKLAQAMQQSMGMQSLQNEVDEKLRFVPENGVDLL
ncbi:unnamed protein product [Owenia fusiformis]|uniref:Beta-glucuronidase n=1 Tax=Owenia fusiformis TaxID=6347 RepID=A0A8J1UK54_OWEFU|nr:unnamed protein product [Owenia fusiformis]